MFVLTSSFYSCIEIFPVPENRNGEAWGFNSSEVVQLIEFNDRTSFVEIEYKARVTSSRHGIRILFPEISREVKTFSIAKDIRKQLDNFEFRIEEEGQNKVITQFVLDFDLDESPQLSYLGRDSLVACVILNDFKLIKNVKYRIYLEVPHKKDVDVRVRKAKLALGTKGYSHF